MTKFSEHDRIIRVNATDNFGEFMGSTDVEVKAHTGLPANVTELPLPKYDVENERCYLVDGRWSVTPFFIGRIIYLEFGQELEVPEYPWDNKPEVFSFTKPPVAEEGFLPILIDGEWDYTENNEGKIAYAKDRNDDDFELERYDVLPATHTLAVYQAYSVYDEASATWVFSDVLYLPRKIEEESDWAEACWIKVIRAIDNHKVDAELPEALRTCTLTEEEHLALLTDRKALYDYTNAVNFPDNSRPTLSTVIKY